MKIGDKVKVINPLRGFECNIKGVIVSCYGKERVIIKTAKGNTWALKKCELLND